MVPNPGSMANEVPAASLRFALERRGTSTEVRSSEPCARHQAHLNGTCPHHPPALDPKLDAAVLPSQPDFGSEVDPRSRGAFVHPDDEPHIGCAPQSERGQHEIVPK